MLKNKHQNAKLVQYPKIRRVLSAMLATVQRKHMMLGLVEMDVTKAHQYMRENKARIGESLAFTAFIATCLAHSVDENKSVQAYRKGKNKLIIFDDVDVTVQVERNVNGQNKVGDRQKNRVDTMFPHIIRAANKKSFWEIHREIRTAQEERVEKTKKFKTLQWTASLPTFMIIFIWRLVWWMIMSYPRLQKNYGGTVGITAVGMFGKGSGWGIPTAAHTLDITLGGIGEKAVRVDGQVEFREYLSMTISVDHDVIDGAPATRFALRLKELIESGYGLFDQDSATRRNNIILQD
jgi:pyruvate/2-oxoglutarate dehydrogenase complex dihydrolipoamide acyltransferase (E2) component